MPVPQDYKTTRLQDYKITRLQDYKRILLREFKKYYFVCISITDAYMRIQAIVHL
ncbi:hypothetical protein CAL7716_015340 [Calothrix sp. PCC 7716]|nr:hypothetical protein CAL7716_015340 [Calothrix sp. PCC 7716]